MNAWQAARQLRSLLLAAAWPDGTAGGVFGDVLVTQDEFSAVSQAFRSPMALIRVGQGTADRQQPKLIRQQIEVALVVALPGGAGAQASLLGGPRTGGQGASSGRGLLEVEEQLLRVAGKLGGANGVRLQLVGSGAGEPVQDPRHGWLVARGFVFEAWLSSERSYPAPVNLVATAVGASSGQVTLTWRNPPSRFDLLSVILRRASGSTAPASATDGTGVTLSGPLAISVTDTPGAGTWSYALFAAYDEVSATPATADRYSSSITRTGVVAT